jgi:xanthine dehydrogenase YagS FAD-binding subunit
MNPFTYHRATSLADAISRGGAADAAYLAGGTTLVDLMRMGVMRPATVIDIGGLADLRGVELGATRFRFGALASMAETASDPTLRERAPALAQSLALAASPQLRNMATLGGNILQRTRCGYFRDVAVAECNKRTPGSGCIRGVNRNHAVLGTSDACVATMPSDWAVALAAFDATIEVAGASGRRSIPIAAFHRPYGEDPAAETTLAHGEIVTAIIVPASAALRRSTYLKVRDRQSYAFALASAAVGLEVEGGMVRAARIALGGVASKPWRAEAAERALVGRPLTEATATEAARLAFEGARPLHDNRFKIPLGQRTIAAALLSVGGLAS